MSTAVVIGKFQAPTISGRTKAALEDIGSKHDRILILVNQPKYVISKNCLLSYSLRAKMLSSFIATLPKVVDFKIEPLHQEEYESVLYKNIDRTIASYTSSPVLIYIGDDELWFTNYSGKHPFVPISYEGSSNETIRGILLKEREDGRTTMSFRAGFMYANATRPKLYVPKITLLLLTPNKEVVLVKRHDDHKFVLMKSMLASADLSVEDSCRKLTGLVFPSSAVGKIRYLYSYIGEDWYTKGSGDAVVNLIYEAQLVTPIQKKSMMIDEYKTVKVKTDVIRSLDLRTEDSDVMSNYLRKYYLNEYNNVPIY